MLPTGSVNIVLATVLLLTLIAVWLGYRLAHQGFFCNRSPILALLLCIICTAAFAGGGLSLPFYLHQGNQVTEQNLVVDLMLFGLAPLIMIALVGYAMDHLMERPSMLMIGAAACFAMPVIPVGGWFRSEMLERFQITIVAPDSLTPGGIRQADESNGNATSDGVQPNSMAEGQSVGQTSATSYESNDAFTPTGAVSVPRVRSEGTNG